LGYLISWFIDKKDQAEFCFERSLTCLREAIFPERNPLISIIALSGPWDIRQGKIGPRRRNILAEEANIKFAGLTFWRKWDFGSTIRLSLLYLWLNKWNSIRIDLVGVIEIEEIKRKNLLTNYSSIGKCP